MSRAYDNAADGRYQQGGRRNLIINGAMEVAQRATSVSGSTSSGYLTVDRFRANSSGATFNMSQESLTVGQTDIPQNFKKFLRFNATTSNDYAGIRYYHEDVETLQGDVTVSFYAKGTNPADGYVSFSMSQNFGSGGSTEVENIGTNDFILTGSWQRFTFKVSMPSISGKTVGTSSFVRLNWWQEDSASTDAWTIDITGVQLEYGNVATPFEHRSYGEELALCQRYYLKYKNEVAGQSSTLGMGTYYTPTQYYMVMHFPVTMRTNPTFSSANGTDYFRIYGGNQGADLFANWNGFQQRGTSSFSVYVASGVSGTTGWAGWAEIVSDNAYIDFDAEL